MKNINKLKYEESKLISVNTVEFCSSMLLNFEMLIEYFSEKIGMDINRLKIIIEESIADGPYINGIDNLLESINEKNNLRSSKSSLERRYVNYLLKLLNYDFSSYSKIPHEIEILAINYFKAYLISQYYIAKSIEKINGREKNISMLKGFIDDVTRKTNREGGLDKAEDILFQSMRKVPDRFLGSFDLTEFKLNDGTVGMKIKRCKVADALKDINDSEYSYALACHYDFEICKCLNPNIELTRNKTLIQGHEFCDFIWHDKSFTEYTRHPSDDFWNSI